MVKCQSKRFESDTGWAQKCGDGEGDEADSSAASFMRRRRVGDMSIEVGSGENESQAEESVSAICNLSGRVKERENAREC